MRRIKFHTSRFFLIDVSAILTMRYLYDFFFNLVKFKTNYNKTKSNFDKMYNIIVVQLNIHN